MVPLEEVIELKGDKSVEVCHQICRKAGHNSYQNFFQKNPF